MSSSNSAVSLPAPALRPFITQYAGSRACGVPPGTHVGLPSRHVYLIISLGQPIDVIQMPNATQRPATFSAFVSGLQDIPAIVRQGGDIHILHLFLTPLGVRGILGVSSAEIASAVVNLSDIWGCCAGDLIERLMEANTWRQRFAILDRAFVASMASRAETKPIRSQPELAWAWRSLAQTHGSMPIEQIAREIGWSRRHFSQRFRDEIGLTPKSAARVFRFELACGMIKNQRPSLAHVALACGYYDQAHMTREWNTLAGCPPNAWISRELPFLQDYELAGGDNGFESEVA